MWLRHFAWAHVHFDCAGSHKVVAAPFALPGQSSRAGAVLVFGHEVHFAWQAQGIRHSGASKRSFYVAGARNRRLCKFRGRRSVLWTLQKRWQACVIRRIAFHVAGAGDPHHGCDILR